MIEQITERKMEKFGEFGNSTAFTIKATAKSFRLLISNVYSDPISSVLREYGQNSTDSHIAAGKANIPIKISLPSAFEPNLVIEDFGTGISHSYFMNEYAQIFESSKTGSNDFSGAYGLGRCSALSISDSYICDSFVDGVRRVYSVFIDKTGVPTVCYMGEEATDRENGLIVNIPVDPKTANSFHQKAKEAFRHYKVRPQIVNVDNFEIPENKYLILATDGEWGLLGASSNSAAISGGYAYPIEENSITGITDIQRKLLQSGFVCHFDIGMIEPSASRESLFYSEHTIKNIKAKLDSVVPFVKPAILKSFEGKNIFERMELNSSLFSYQGSLSGLADLSREFIRELAIPHHLKFENFNVISFYRNYRRGNYRVRKSESNEIEHSEKNSYIFGDKKTNLKLRAKKFFEDSTKEHNKLVFLIPLTNDAVANFKTKFDYDLSTFPAVTSLTFDRQTKTGGLGERFLEFTGKSSSWRGNAKDSWSEAAEEDFDEDDDIIYVERKGNYLENGADLYNLTQQWESYKTLTKTGVTIWGLTARQVKKYKQSNWKTFDEAFKLAKAEYEKTVQDQVAAYRYYQTNYDGFRGFSELKGLDKETLLYKIIAEYKQIQKDYAGLQTELVSHITVKASDKYSYNRKMVEKHYPILELIKDYGMGDNKATRDLVEYINGKGEILIDSGDDKE